MQNSEYPKQDKKKPVSQNERKKMFFPEVVCVCVKGFVVACGKWMRMVSRVQYSVLPAAWTNQLSYSCQYIPLFTFAFAIAVVLSSKQ